MVPVNISSFEATVRRLIERRVGQLARQAIAELKSSGNEHIRFDPEASFDNAWDEFVEQMAGRQCGILWEHYRSMLRDCCRHQVDTLSEFEVWIMWRCSDGWVEWNPDKPIERDMRDDIASSVFGVAWKKADREGAVKKRGSGW